MKIALVGGGTGGHFYPLMAVAAQIRKYVEERHIVDPELIYIGPEPFDAQSLLEHNIRHVPHVAGKLRRDETIGNIGGLFKTGWGVLQATSQLFSLFPDVILSTGGYAAFPTMVAARFLGIPVIVYDADAKPGKVSLWSSSFARWIAVAHPDAAAHFPKAAQSKVVRTGHPIRVEIEHPTTEGAHEFLKLDPNRQTILVLGGSQGAQTINDAILDALPELIKKYNIIHQTGKANLDEVTGVAKLNPLISEEHYRAFGLLNTYALRLSAGIASLIICRAGSGTIFEVASWGIPAILVPIPESISHDQVKNAFSYARSGAAIVIEQQNLTPHILVAEIERLLSDQASLVAMKDAAQSFAEPGAAAKIAKALLDIALEHA